MPTSRFLLLSCAFFLSLGCGQRETPRVDPETDGGKPDGGKPDGGKPDGGKEFEAKPFKRPASREADPAEGVDSAMIARLGADRYTATSVAFSPDGRSLYAAGYSSGGVTEYSLETGKPAREIPIPSREGFKQDFRVLAVSDDGAIMAVYTFPGGVLLIDVATGKVVRNVDMEDRVERGAFTAGRRLLVQCGKRVLEIDTAAGKVKASSDEVVDGLLDKPFTVSADGKTVAVGGKDGLILILDGVTLKETARLPAQEDLRLLGLSPDGKTLVSVDKKEVKIFDLTKKAEPRPIKNEGVNTRLAFSPSGKFFAVAGYGMTLYETATGRPLGGLGGYSDTLTSLTFSPDGGLLAGASGSQKGLVLWELRPALKGKAGPGEVDVIAAAPGGTRFATRAAKFDAKGLDIGPPGGKTERSLPADTGTPAAFSPDGKLLAYTPDGDKVLLIDAASGAAKGELAAGEVGRPKILIFSPDGKRLMLAGSKAQAWDVAARKPLGLFGEFEGEVGCAAFSPDGKQVAFGAGPRLHLADVTTGKIAWSVPAQDGAVTSVAFSPDGKRLLTGGGDGRSARLWGLDGKQAAVFRPAAPAEHVHALFVDGGGTVVLLGKQKYGHAYAYAYDAGVGTPLGWRSAPYSRGKPVLTGDGKALLLKQEKGSRLIDLGGMTKEAFAPFCVVPLSEPAPQDAFSPDKLTLENPLRGMLAGAFSADGKRYVAVDREKRVAAWDLPAKRPTRDFVLPAGELQSVAISPDGKSLAVGLRDGVVCIADIASGKVAKTLGKHASFVRAIAFSPDGKWVASGTGGFDETEIFLWDVGAGKLARQLAKGGKMVDSLVFSPDGRMLYVGAESVRRFSIPDGAESPALTHHESINAVAVSPDGKLIAAGGGFSSLGVNDVSVWKADGTKVRMLPRQGWNVSRLMFGADGLLAVQGGQGARLYHAGTGKEIARISEGIHGFSPDGSMLAGSVGQVGEVSTLGLRDVASIRDAALQGALAPALAGGASAVGEGGEVRVELAVSGPDSLAALAALGGLKRPLSLKLMASGKMPPEAAKPLAGLKTLRRLDRDGGVLDDGHLTALASLPALETLDLASCSALTPKALATLGGAVKLKELKLDYALSDAAGLEALAKLEGLRGLSLAGCSLTGKAGETLALFGKLESLAVGTLDAAAAKKVAGLKGLRGLKLGNTDLDPALAKELAHLTELEIGPEKLDGPTVAALGALGKLRRLVVGVPVGDEEVKALAKLTGLASLRVGGEKVTDAAVASLAGLAKLESLTLFDTGMTDKALAALEKMPALRELMIQGKGITDEGRAAFSKKRPEVRLSRY